MSERPPIPGKGQVRATLLERKLYEVEMPNGFRTRAYLTGDSPPPPSTDLEGETVELEFSPYDMSRGRIVRWGG